AGALPPDAPPQRLISNAHAAGFALEESTWRSLDDEERFALAKLGGGDSPSHNLPAALGEFRIPSLENQARQK
ncbi:MAG TPA: nitrate reductase associated protein, partial [Candidatus Binataceae bacterium]